MFWTASHVFPAGGDPFFAEIQEVYDEIGEGLPPDAVRPGRDVGPRISRVSNLPGHDA